MKRKPTVPKDMITNQEDVLYIGADVHERESQLAIFETSGSLVMERRIPTSNLESFINSIPGEKYVAIESVGFIYPIYDRLSSLREFYLRLRHKRGEKKALIAVARKMVTYAYWMLKRNQTYEELAPWLEP